jgi:hypothetical protein
MTTKIRCHESFIARALMAGLLLFTGIFTLVPGPLSGQEKANYELAARYPFIDLNRVGIYGHSGGGFMTAAALLVYPDFFKVGVSASGNHENNIYNRWWSEKHHGVKEVVDKDGQVKY